MKEIFSMIFILTGFLFAGLGFNQMNPAPIILSAVFFVIACILQVYIVRSRVKELEDYIKQHEEKNFSIEDILSPFN